MRFDDKFLNGWNWFINSKIMTLIHFDLKKSLCDAQVLDLIFTKFKNFQNKQQNLHK